MNDNASNNRVTLEVIRNDIMHLTHKVDDHHNDNKEWRKEDKSDREEYEKRIRANEKDITTLKAIFGIWGGVNSAWAGILTWLGTR